MPTLTDEVILNAPARRVWAFITALRYLPRWLEGVASVQAISDAQPTDGTTFTVLRQGKRDDESWLVAEAEAPRRLRLIEYRRNREFLLLLEDIREGTRLSMRYTWPEERGLFGRFFPPTSQRQMVARTLARLKDLIALNQDLKLLHGMGDE